MNDYIIQKVRNVLGIPFSNVSRLEAMFKIEASIASNKKLLVTVLDAAMVMNMRNNRASDIAIRDSEMILADGYYVVLASRILGEALPEQITGFDLAMDIMKMASDKGFRIFFLGAEEDIIQRVKGRVVNLFGEQAVAGVRNGYFKSDEEERVVNEINASGADILLVGISSPIRELFLSRYKDKLDVNVLMGVGGVFDILGGKTQRAPLLVQRMRIEWLYRFLLEPKRMWRRVFVLYPSFSWMVFKGLFKKGR